MPAISSFTSLAMIGAIGSQQPELAKDDSSSSEDEGDDMTKITQEGRELCRSISSDSCLSSGATFCLSPDPSIADSTCNGNANPVFTFGNETPPPTYEDVDAADKVLLLRI